MGWTVGTFIYKQPLRQEFYGSSNDLTNDINGLVTAHDRHLLPIGAKDHLRISTR